MDTTTPLSGPYTAVAALPAHTPLGPPDTSPRAALEAEIERLIEILNLIDGDPDLEPDGDIELDKSDSEPSLGSLDRQIDQRLWNAGALDDCEEGDDDEPSLGWPNPMAARIVAWDLDEDGSSVPVLADDLRLQHPAETRP